MKHPVHYHIQLWYDGKLIDRDSKPYTAAQIEATLPQLRQLFRGQAGVVLKVRGHSGNSLACPNNKN
jgi:hypothetical protein